MYCAYGNVSLLINWGGSHFFFFFSSCFNNALFCVCLVSCIIIWGGVCASRLVKHSLPLFNYKYLMFYVFQIVCKGKVCEAILYSLQTSEFQSSKAYFWENLFDNPQCQM